MRQVRARTIGLFASLAIVLLIFVAPIVLIAIGMAPWDLDVAKIGSLLGAPDDGHLAIALVAGVAWLAWAVLSFTIGTEVVSRIRGVDAPRMPPLALAQQFAGRLVTVAALLFVAAPTVAPAVASPSASGSDPIGQVKVGDNGTAPTEPSPTPPDRRSDRAPTGPAKPSTTDHTVRPGETLWKIADQRFGDGARWREIFELNQGTLGDRPDFIRPGTRLLVPAVDEHTAANATYVVRPGDTLSEIAEDVLGSASRYPEIFDASRHTAQPAGGMLSDPDLIVPGWRLTVPEGRPDPSETDAKSPDPATRRLGAEPRTDAGGAAAGGDTAADSQRDSPSWLVPGLTGAGALLAGALLLTLRSHRRTQLRYRSPGQVIASPPDELRNIERSAQASGDVTAASVEKVDRLLRHLAAAADESGETPELLLAEASDGSLVLHLATACTLPEPWRGSGTTWAAKFDATIEDIDQVPPFPLLVTLGKSNDGHLWLVNLEQTGPVSLTGDSDSALNLARHIAAELVLNPWASLVDVDLLGLGSELAALDPVRLRIHVDEDAEFASGFADDLAKRSVSGAPERPRALVCASPDHSETINGIASMHNARACTAIVVVSPNQESDWVSIFLSPDRTLRSEFLGRDLSAAGLTADEAQACAAIVDVTRTAAPQSAHPASDVTDSPPEDELRVDNRDPTEPVTTTPARSGITSDPGLDDDLQAWLDPASSLPRLSLLGPVRAKACGDARAVVKRVPYYTEVLAYLALHPDGVTPMRLADDLGISATRARVDVNAVRNWLGNNPRTGAKHVPDADASRAARDRGVPTYQVEGLLTDLDLFNRLRKRASSGGGDDIDDLIQALNLMAGQPFDQLRPGGWSWLLDGDRVDHVTACAVVDVAHLVTNHALRIGDMNLAEFATRTALRAAPYDEIAKLDLAAVLAAGGHDSEAQRLVDEQILNRTDDDLGPTELAPRTATILSRSQTAPNAPE